jgi:hypothetical protein
MDYRNLNAEEPDNQGISKAQFAAAMTRLLTTEKIRIEETGPKSRRSQTIVPTTEIEPMTLKRGKTAPVGNLPMAASMHVRKTALHSPQFQLRPIETAGREHVAGRRCRHSHLKICLYYCRNP